MRTREYIVTQEKVGNGATCPVANGTVETDTSACSVDCQGSWSAWSSCQGGERAREYIVTQEKVGNGASCPVADGTVETDTSACSVDCQGSWSAWICENGNRSRFYTVTREKVGSGASCPVANGTTEHGGSCGNNDPPSLYYCNMIMPSYTWRRPPNNTESQCIASYNCTSRGCS